MRCSLCGFQFNEKTAERGCKNCPVSVGCDLARCPNCGFEMPVEPEWIKKLTSKLTRLLHELHVNSCNRRFCELVSSQKFRRSVCDALLKIRPSTRRKVNPEQAP